MGLYDQVELEVEEEGKTDADSDAKKAMVKKANRNYMCISDKASVERKWKLFLVCTIFIVGCSVVVSLVIGIQNQSTHDELFEVNNDLGVFHTEYLKHVGNTRYLHCLPRVYEIAYNDSLSIYKQIDEEMTLVYEAVNNFEDSYDKSKRKAPLLKSIKNRIDSIVDQGHFIYEMRDLIIKLSRDWPEDIVEYLIAYDTFGPSATEHAFVMDTKIRRARNALAQLSHQSSDTAIATATVSSIIALLALICIFMLVLSLFQRTRLQLRALDTLVKQQAHELRNCFAPAIIIMEAVAEIPSSEDDELSKYQSDLRTAISLLRDAETMHKARLDCLKIMQGKYSTEPKELNLISFMNQHLYNELEIHQRMHPDQPDGLHFQACFSMSGSTNTNNRIKNHIRSYPATSPRHQEDDDEADKLMVRCDPFILEHVTKNLLKNARKFSSQGTITFCFHGASMNKKSRLLVFSVQDQGCGIPESIRSQLFCHQVTTGETRGAGLGLPSCQIFCDVVNGYIRLVESRRTPQSRSGSIIEFAIEGTVLDTVSLTGKAHSSRPPSVSSINTGVSVSTTPRSSSMPDDEKVLHSSIKNVTSTANSTSSSKTSPLPPSIQEIPISQQVSLDDHVKKILPDNLEVVVIDDSVVNRRAVIIRLQKVARETKATGWTFCQFPTVESAQPHLASIKKNKYSIVTMDQELISMGGTLTGSDGIKFLASIQYKGCIISASGTPEIGAVHLKLGAHFSWPKPLPSVNRIIENLVTHFKTFPGCASLSQENNPAALSVRAARSKEQSPNRTATQSVEPFTAMPTAAHAEKKNTGKNFYGTGSMMGDVKEEDENEFYY